MTHFLDGPAEGRTMDTRRAPVFLRVVEDRSTGKFDVLDLLDDTPTPSERVFVYQREPGTWGQVFACTRSRRGGGRYEYGSYRHLPGVDGEQLRETSAWRGWTEREDVRRLYREREGELGEALADLERGDGEP